MNHFAPTYSKMGQCSSARDRKRQEVATYATVITALLSRGPELAMQKTFLSRATFSGAKPITGVEERMMKGAMDASNGERGCT
jgi:hypothetical protein